MKSPITRENIPIKCAATYVRMSTDRQNYSTAHQKEHLSASAAERGLSIACEYGDEGKSGLAQKGRPGLRSLLADVQSDTVPFRTILVYDVSRWGRFQDVDESAHYEYVCRSAGVEIIYCAESFNNGYSTGRRERRGFHPTALNFLFHQFVCGSLNDPNLHSYIVEQLSRYSISPEFICFEITETAVIANLSNAQIFMSKLKAIGCRFSLDDFGSGLSSFAYLKALPVDMIKIDGIFVRDIATNAVNRAMVKAINEVGHVMGLRTVAEYVEDEDTLDIVREIGLDYAQGYAVGRACPLIARV